MTRVIQWVPDPPDDLAQLWLADPDHPGVYPIAVIIGPPGPPGTSAEAGGGPYVHDQLIAASEWIINHNKGYRPLVEVMSPGGVHVTAEIQHISANQVRVYFNQAQTGLAIMR